MSVPTSTSALPFQELEAQDPFNQTSTAFGSPPQQLKLADLVFMRLQGINMVHVAYKTCAYTLLAIYLLLGWAVYSGLFYAIQGRASHQSDRIPIRIENIASYFDGFTGRVDCGINAADLYNSPLVSTGGPISRKAFCQTRSPLLEALSSGGRIGFDAPYIPKGCHYRWFSAAETCMILERFDGLVFIGDDSLQTVYSGLQILVRQDLVSGALKQWEMHDDEIKDCTCDLQFTKESCRKFTVTTGEEVVRNHGNVRTNKATPYACYRKPQELLLTNGAPFSAETIAGINRLVPRAPPSHYKPIPTVFSLTAQHSTSAASKTLDELIHHLDVTRRKTPILWLGPNAQGHLADKTGASQQDIWRFSDEMTNAAKTRDVEVINMWNMTVQASSYDGKHYGEAVAITQAMMVINWLSRLATS